MKNLFLHSALLASLLGSASVQGQAPAPATPGGEAAAPAVPTLTDEQVSKVLTQLKELETQIQQMRGNTLGTVLTRLRAAMASDQAAMALYLDCDNIVNSERKEVDKSDARRRQENMEKNMERKPKGGGNNAANDDGDIGFAIRLGIQYLVLTLEAHEAKEEDFKKMAPKLQEYVQALVAAAPKLKGRSHNMLSNALGNNNPIVSAFNLSRYLTRKNWAARPTDIGAIYTQTLIPLAEGTNKESLPGLWDARINAEGIFRKENMFAPEFELWTQNELPTLRWQRATYLYEKGPSPITAMAEMLKLIRENPGHPDAPNWVKELRELVNQSAPAQKSPNLENASSGS